MITLQTVGLDRPVIRAKQQRAALDEATDKLVREYLDRVAPMPNLSEIQAELLAKLPPPASCLLKTPLRGIVGPLLVEIERYFAKEEPKAK